MKKSFHDLFIWQRSVDLAIAIIDLTRRFSRADYVFVSQMQRCAISIPSNIAEGAGRLSSREFHRYLGIARGSACELETQLEIALRAGILSESVYQDLKGHLALISTGINRLLAKVKELR